MPGKSLEMKASEKFHELSDNYFNTPAPPEPELVSIPNLSPTSRAQRSVKILRRHPKGTSTIISVFCY